ncbi:MAG TPA: YqhA family protein [Thermoanaerobaculia bacterium]|jgi:uncharacterized membrane protein YqhA|nr:YqhA family protein [Thermoanaerobaculia bacterium]
MRRFLAASRLAILVAVLASLVAFFTLLVAGALKMGKSVVAFAIAADLSPDPVKKLALALIETADLFLLATVFYLMTVGLYELFVGERIELPAWMAIESLDDLKTKLCKVIIVLLGVLFLGEAVHWNGDTNLLPYGAATALMIAALTLFLSVKGAK